MVPRARRYLGLEGFNVEPQDPEVLGEWIGQVSLNLGFKDREVLRIRTVKVHLNLGAKGPGVPGT